MQKFKLQLAQERVESQRLARPKKVSEVKQTLPSYVTDDHMFAFVVITDGKYEHPWYGEFRYDLARLMQIKENHASGVLREQPMLRKGHASFFEGGGAPAYGWFLEGDEALEIVKFTEKSTGNIRYGLLVHGYYNKRGYESVVLGDEYRYLSSEIITKYFERQKPDIDEDAASDMVDANTGDPKKDIDRAGKEDEEPVPDAVDVFAGLALTNTPFIHDTSLSPEDVEVVSFHDLYVQGKYDKASFFHFEDKLYAMCDSGVCYAVEDTEFIEDHGVRVASLSLDKVLALDELTLPVQEQKKEEVGQTDELPKQDQFDIVNDKRVEPQTEKTMEFVNLTLEELEAFDASKLSESEMVVYTALIEGKRAQKQVELEAARALKEREDFAREKERMERQLAALRERSVKAEAEAFSLRVDKLQELADERGVPSAITEYIVEFAHNLDIESRNATVKLTNAAKGVDEEKSVMDFIEGLVAKFSSEMWRSGTPSIDRQELEAVEAPKDSGESSIDVESTIEFLKG